MPKTTKVRGENRFPIEDEIRWVEYELLRAEHGAEWEKSAIGDSPQALRIWLAHVRDKKSWKEIGAVYYPKSHKPEARRSEARRAWEKVERYLNDPNAPEFYEHKLRRLILEQFGVSAEDFRAFVLEGHLPRKAKIGV